MQTVMQIVNVGLTAMAIAVVASARSIRLLTKCVAYKARRITHTTLKILMVLIGPLGTSVNTIVVRSYVLPVSCWPNSAILHILCFFDLTFFPFTADSQSLQYRFHRWGLVYAGQR